MINVPNEVCNLREGAPNDSVSVADPWHFGTDPDPHLWLTDPDSNPDLAPDIFVSKLQDGN